ncbi:exodeoxyribonuclease VII large subunit, partial [Enterococcus faecalis]|uniref:exodeoxyribonuclease VII large subunit n=1 Tax=Enterococcus faecalis TaxID=1351 RepID=UPI003CC5EB43
PKQQLPRYPNRIAVVTSPSGAVIRDFITTVKRRYPIAQLVLFPTMVQGEQAADDIVRNIQRADAQGHIDTKNIGRGGGS